MTDLFLDTGYLIALETTDDQHHEETLDHWRILVPSLPPLVTTSYVFSEVNSHAAQERTAWEPNILW